MKSLQESLLDIEGTEKSITGTALDASSRIEIGVGYGSASTKDMIDILRYGFNRSKINSDARSISSENKNKITMAPPKSGDNRGNEYLFLNKMFHPELYDGSEEDRDSFVNLLALIVDSLPCLALAQPSEDDWKLNYETDQKLWKSVTTTLRKYFSKDVQMKIKGGSFNISPEESWKRNCGGDHYVNIMLSAKGIRSNVVGVARVIPSMSFSIRFFD